MNYDEIDYLIATRINNWACKGSEWYNEHGESVISKFLFRPSEDCGDALNTTIKYIGTEGNVTISKLQSGKYLVMLYNINNKAQAEHEELSLAICNALLKYSGVIINTSIEPIGVRCRCPL